MMKICVMLNILLTFLSLSMVHAQGIEADLRSCIENVLSEHPRLFAARDEWPALEAHAIGAPAKENV